MTLWAFSITVGIAMVELYRHLFQGIWFRNQLALTFSHLQELRQAKGDDMRQRAMLRGGSYMLRFSLVCMCLVFAGVLTISITPWLFGWNEELQARYLFEISISATLWWLSTVTYNYWINRHDRRKSRL